jgi:uncharacterized repeat protein (TIGR03803 family)
MNKIIILSVFCFLSSISALSQNSKLIGLGCSSPGDIFSINDDGTSLKQETFFRDGKNPLGSLIKVNSQLYGMTYSGGNADRGIIFRIDSTGNNFHKLFSFGTTSGGRPFDNLVYLNGKLWGMTFQYGINNGGTIFRINLDGSNFQVVHNFVISTSGAFPRGSLIHVGSKFWGLTSVGGSGSKGIIFSLDTNGSGFQNVHEFSSTGQPTGTLTFSQGKLWGMTNGGGTNGKGSIFSIDTSGFGFFEYYSFIDSSGMNPIGSLIELNGNLWGMTFAGGQNSDGTIFKFLPSDSSHNIVLNLSNSIGSRPWGDLLVVDSKFYGMTSQGGSANGVIFQLDTSGSNYSVKHNFISSSGSSPYGNLVKCNNRLWGMTNLGGKENDGVLFSTDLTGTDYQMLHDFSSEFFESPEGSLIEVNGKFFGVNSNGGKYHLGSIFSFDPITYQQKNHFDFNDTLGMGPKNGLIKVGNKLYGSTFSGGLNGMGVIFCINDDGSGFQVLLNFEATNGGFPRALLKEYNGKLWGGTVNGNPNIYGTLFSINLDGSSFTKILDLNSSTGNALRGLTISNNFFWGVFEYQGTNSVGTIFRMNLDGSGFSKIHDFDGINGGRPAAELYESNGYLWGRTTIGGSSGLGLIYRIDTSGAGYTKIHEFSNSDGAGGYGSLIEVKGRLWGLNQSYGLNSRGSIFSIDTSGTGFIKHHDLSLDVGALPTGSFVLYSPNTTPSITGTIPSIAIPEDTSLVSFDLTPYFDDAEDGASGLTYTIDNNTNPSIFSTLSVILGFFNFNLAPDQFGSSDITIKATDSGGKSISSTFTITVNGVADDPQITNTNTNYGDQNSSGLVATRNANDGTEVSHFQITQLLGGSLFQNDGSTPISNDDFITVAEGNAGLKFSGSAVGTATFKIQAATGNTIADLGGNKVTASITVNQRPITVTANAKNKECGDPDPVLDYAITTGSLVGVDSFTGSLSRAAGESIGNYAITQGGLSAGANYNLSFVAASLTIADNVAPISDIAILSDFLAECQVSGLAAPTATDACSGSINGTHNASLPITTQGTTVVIWTYADGNGNSVSQTQNVIINDISAPIPDQASLSAISGSCPVNSPIAPTATDNCVGALTGTTATIFPITATGTTVITWSYDDGNGNTSTQTQDIIVSALTGTDVATICQGDSFFLGSQVLTTGGVYNETFQSGQGCDSIVTLTLNVNPSFSSSATASICNGQSYQFGTQTLIAAGLYSETFIAANGCDSVVTLTLTVNPIFNATANASICNGQTFVFGTQTLTSAGTFNETFSTQLGCDSIVTLTLVVNDTFVANATASICDGTSLVFGSQVLTSAGIYTEVFATQSGCDSTITLTLAVSDTFSTTTSTTICDGDNYIFGSQVLTTAGNYSETFLTQAGCDSIVDLTLNVTVVDDSVSLQGTTLTANAIGASYQWLDCGNGFQPISGATGQTYTPLVSGNYSVLVNENNCSDTSACTFVLIVGLESAYSNKIDLYPNPFSNRLHFELEEKNQIGGILEILDIHGRVLRTWEIKELKTDLLLSDLAGGTYVYKYVQAENVEWGKMIKK